MTGSAIPGESGTLGAAQAAARARLAALGVATAALDARLLLAAALDCPPDSLLVRRDQPLEAPTAGRFEAMLQRRLRGEPVAHLLGRREFWSLPLRVTADTLIPRPDSETLVEAALDWARARLGGRRSVRSILDLGTGSGCLLLALLTELPDADGVGLDRSPAALEVARGNAQALGMAGRVQFVCADWADPLAGAFDLVVGNPPYIADDEWPGLPDEVRRFEPSLALRGGADGCAAYRRIFAALPRLLPSDGSAWVEIGGVSAAAVPAIATAAGLQVFETRKDLAGRPRALGVRSCTAAKDKNFLGNPVVPV